MTVEVPMPGGRITAGVVRVGDEVRRPTGPHSDFVHEVLLRLESAGVDAPRFRGLDAQGRERLSFLDGWVAPDLDHGAWTDPELTAAAQLIRRHHDALAGTVLVVGHETVCHNDLGPCNAVHRDGLPVAFIDWDTAAPGARVNDFAHAIWRWAVTSDTDELPLDEQVRRIDLMCDAYGQRDRVAVLDTIEVNMDRVIAQSARRGDGGSVEWHTGERTWFQQHRRKFEHGLRVR